MVNAAAHLAERNFLFDDEGIFLPPDRKSR